jgi:hypothetical protein
MKPNIFEISTKELSQDGFFTWLLQWADPSNAKYNDKLNKCANAFVKLLLKNNIHEDIEIKKVEAGRQWEKIDIWVNINDKYLIIIEDKTSTGEHSYQLERYKATAIDWCKENNYEQPICIYLKTGSEAQSSLNTIAERGYSIISRSDLLDIFKSFKIDNDIYNDFIERIKRLEKAENAFETKKIKNWDNSCWIGFFRFLESQEALSINGWGFVNTPAGGFYGMWWFGHEWKKYWVYLQIEQGKLCFKISEVNRNHSKIRDDIFNIIMEKVEKKKKPEILKPPHFGKGKWMTIAIVNQKDWLGDDNDILNKAKVIEKLKDYDKFLKYCVK